MSMGLHGTQRWRKRAQQQLRNEPLCCMCLKQGVIEAATVADHVVPHRNEAELFWNGALQSLCKRHHDSTKQAFEKSKQRVNACDINGKPIDLI
jgi:5-methylcytosine-specific restriction protein A